MNALQHEDRWPVQYSTVFLHVGQQLTSRILSKTSSRKSTQHTAHNQPQPQIRVEDQVRVRNEPERHMTTQEGIYPDVGP